MVIDVDVALLLQQQLGETLGLGENATIFEICAAIDAEGLVIPAVIDALELDLDPIVTAQISQIVNQIAIAINEITGIPINQALIDEILASIDIDAMVAQITANVQGSLGILGACLDLPPPPPPPNHNVYVLWEEVVTPDNNEIFFTASYDNGNTFSTPINISNSITQNSFDAQLTTEGNNVYILWREQVTPANTEIFFTSSNNNGRTFSSPVN